eukprot:11346457-Heterocapsa_arctica.AAC.1
MRHSINNATYPKHRYTRRPLVLARKSANICRRLPAEGSRQSLSLSLAFFCALTSPRRSRPEPPAASHV